MRAIGVAWGVLVLAASPAWAGKCNPPPAPGTSQASVYASCGQPDKAYYPQQHPGGAQIGPLQVVWVNGGGQYDIVWFVGGVVRNAAHTTDVGVAK
jgi:hypothetical protein